MTSPRPVLVVGASGYVGSRVARGLAAGGHAVLAAARHPLPDAGDGVVPVGYERAATLPDAVRDVCARDGLPLPGAVVASIGGWHKGAALLDEDPDRWTATLASHLTAHLDVARALAPLLGPGDPYVVLNGAASREPMAGSGAICVTGAGLAMLVQVLRLEAEQAPSGAVRFHELVIDHAVAGDDRNADPAQTRTTAQVVTALRGVLDDAAAPPVTHV
ncbi:hypothetical protein ACH47X_05885 [Promicromonospora kroppenstedtii]|uniref:NAD(P)-dependent dehydrogenase (Short-subunit alcohol dehydrogenase family) n=1 Tax=Promicromonospora kroppenstedtii TaxID=440482 RepID=A0ABW7XFZ4_9MICO